MNCCILTISYRAPRSRLQVSIMGPLRYERNTLPLRQVAISVLPYAYRRIRTAENWVMRTPQTLYQQVCKHSVSIGGFEPPRELNSIQYYIGPFRPTQAYRHFRAPH